MESPRLRILLVEDDLGLAASFIRVLKGKVEVCVAGTAADAKIALRADPGFTAAIVDYWLPDDVGSALARELRRIVPGLPILVVTGDLLREPANEAWEAGVEFHYKPVDLALVLEFLTRAAARQQRNAEAVAAFGLRFGFTPRERDVFEHAVAGGKRKDIALLLRVSESRVKALVRSMLAKARECTLEDLVTRFRWGSEV